MESLSTVLSSSPSFQPHDYHPEPHRLKLTSPKFLHLHSNPHFFSHHQPTRFTPTHQNPSDSAHTHFLITTTLKTHASLLLLGLSTPLSCSASEQASDRINLESIVFSFDDFITRYPFFVPGVVFIWLVVIPLAQAYFRKYKFILAIDAFRKLRDDPSVQLLDIRDKKSSAFLCSPNLKYLKKIVLQVPFSEDNEGGFVKKVLENYRDPENTSVCVLDNFDGNSMRVAELLFKNGFKQGYAIKGGVRGKNGWQEIQENLLPPAVHVKRRKRVKKLQRLQMNGINQGNEVDNGASSPQATAMENKGKMELESVNQPVEATPGMVSSVSTSRYSDYPDMEPPSSPQN